jgi:hypothetical protein
MYNFQLVILKKVQSIITLAGLIQTTLTFPHFVSSVFEPSIPNKFKSHQR